MNYLYNLVRDCDNSIDILCQQMVALIVYNLTVEESQYIHNIPISEMVIMAIPYI